MGEARAPLSELTRIQLTRTLSLTQRAKGHRTGTDDVLCAWAGLTAVAGRTAVRILDLGSGHGSVALMLAGALPEAEVVAVEAQAVSFELLRRNIDDNGLSGRVRPVLGDLREVDLDAPGFDLVTGSPPFMPVGTGVMPQDEQRAAARFELRGGIEAYCAAAARALAPDGTVSLLMDAARPERYRAAFGGAGLALRRVVEVLPRPAAPPTYGIYQGRPGVAGGVDAGPVEVDRLHVREVDNAWSEAFLAIRHALDLPT